MAPPNWRKNTAQFRKKYTRCVSYSAQSQSAVKICQTQYGTFCQTFQQRHRSNIWPASLPRAVFFASIFQNISQPFPPEILTISPF
jgi:hypothetical protein